MEGWGDWLITGGLVLVLTAVSGGIYVLANLFLN